MFKFLTDDLREELAAFLDEVGCGPLLPLDECQKVYDRLFEIVNLAIARAYARFKEDAVVAVQLIMAEEQERRMTELYLRRQNASAFPQ